MTMVLAALAAIAQVTSGAASAAPTPSPEAEQLGLRLAESGSLATIAPMLADKDVAELVAAHPELGDAEKGSLRETGKRVSADGIGRLNAAFGHAYAKLLSVGELRILVEQAESPAAAKWRGIMPEAMVDALSSVGALDMKKDVLTAFCRETGKLCPAKK